jgi:prevent-host-death family protein
MGVYTVVEVKDQLSKVIDEVESGNVATITKHGKPVATINPILVTKKAGTPEYYAEIARRRDQRGHTGSDSVTAVREMRDDFP